MAGLGSGRRAATGSGLGFTASPSVTRDPDEGLGVDGGRGEPFGGAAGTLTLVKQNGSIFVPPSQKYSAAGRRRAPAHWPPVAAGSISPT